MDWLEFIILTALLLGLAVAIMKNYHRASKTQAIVRTGMGGEKVAIDQGIFIFPLIHNMILINMETLRLEVSRQEKQSLITADKLRVDVNADFYVRVRPNIPDISMAAQTLGNKTTHPEELKKLIEGKFVNALRSTAANMNMEQLHEKRHEFIEMVHSIADEDLHKNGLELESVSLTHLDQTSIEFFNADNIFDAEGLTKITEATQQRTKIRNDIEKETQLAIESKDLETKQKTLELQLLGKYAEMDQEAKIAEYKIIKKQEIDEKQILSDREINIKNIIAERDIRNADIERTQIVEQAEVKLQQVLALSEKDKLIAITQKSLEEIEVKIQADKALAEAVRTEENVATIRETERAERAKKVSIIGAKEIAEKEAISVKTAAEAEKNAAEYITQARVLLSQAKEQEYAVDANGARAINEAANILSDSQIDMQTRLAMLKQLPDIIRESTKPMEKIDSIKIMQVNGLTGNSGSSTHENHDSNSLPDQVVNSALRYRTHAPIVDGLLQELGLNGKDINGMIPPIASNKIVNLPPHSSNNETPPNQNDS